MLRTVFNKSYSGFAYQEWHVLQWRYEWIPAHVGWRVLPTSLQITFEGHATYQQQRSPVCSHLKSFVFFSPFVSLLRSIEIEDMLIA